MWAHLEQDLLGAPATFGNVEGHHTSTKSSDVENHAFWILGGTQGRAHCRGGREEENAVHLLPWSSLPPLTEAQCSLLFEESNLGL